MSRDKQKQRLIDSYTLMEKVIADNDADRRIDQWELLGLLACLVRSHKEFGEGDQIAIPVRLLDVFGKMISKKRNWAADENRKRSAKSIERYRRYQPQANAIWNRHPDWGHTSVAREIYKKIPESEKSRVNVNTLRRRLKKPVA